MSSTVPHSFIQRLKELVQHFEAHRSYYRSKEYNEAQARVDFISPLFEALGWDITNHAHKPHQERDCLVEKGHTEGRPDYNFRVNGATKFFVECKPPSEPIDNPRHIVQAKEYAWNSKDVLFVVLTNFAEFRLYDASIEPDERVPEEGLLIKVAYEGFASRAAVLWEVSRERVYDGSLEAMLPRDKRRVARISGGTSIPKSRLYCMSRKYSMLRVTRQTTPQRKS